LFQHFPKGTDEPTTHPKDFPKGTDEPTTQYRTSGRGLERLAATLAPDKRARALNGTLVEARPGLRARARRLTKCVCARARAQTKTCFLARLCGHARSIDPPGHWRARARARAAASEALRDRSRGVPMLWTSVQRRIVSVPATFGSSTPECARARAQERKRGRALAQGTRRRNSRPQEASRLIHTSHKDRFESHPSATPPFLKSQNFSKSRLPCGA